jgi:microsomal dipeptidase-like Zn-dependent dipeptidase
MVESRAAIFESYIQDKNRGFKPGGKVISVRRRGANATTSITQSRRGRGSREGVDHPKRILDLTEGLIRRKYTDREIELVLGGNFKRVSAQIWSV